MMTTTQGPRAIPEFDAAYDDQSHLEPTVGPDWETIERNLGEWAESTPSVPVTPQTISHLALLAFAKALFRYIRGSSANTQDLGHSDRLLVCEWFLLPELHPLTLTQLARMHGKEKQSLGRAVDEFKRRFPGVRNVHMKE